MLLVEESENIAEGRVALEAGTSVCLGGGSIDGSGGGGTFDLEEVVSADCGTKSN